MIYIGIDPGKTGAIGVLGAFLGPYVVDLEDGRVPQSFRAPAPWHECRVTAELPDARPGKGVRDFLVGAGRLTGYFDGCGARSVILVPATLWSPAMGCSAGDRGIDQRRDLALSLWPELAPVLSRRKDKDRVSALLIAEYGRRRGGL